MARGLINLNEAFSIFGCSTLQRGERDSIGGLIGQNEFPALEPVQASVRPPMDERDERAYSMALIVSRLTGCLVCDNDQDWRPF